MLLCEVGLKYQHGDNLDGFDLDRIFVDAFADSFAINNVFITLVKILDWMNWGRKGEVGQKVVRPARLELRRFSKRIGRVRGDM